MKTVKSKIVAGVTAFMLLFGAFFMVKAITKEEKQPIIKLANQTWYFHGKAGDSRTDATKYQLTPNPETPCGDANEEVCKISAPNDGSGKPNMSAIVSGSQTVAQRINAAFSSTPSTNETVESLRSIQE